ncbi:MAG: sugar nucleotide-binding protein [Anaerolineales bacterium]|nr:sugar nucleotide-binding protein [Anaerolineales bacterium]
MSRLLLTGAAGHLGRRLAGQAAGWELIAAYHVQPVAVEDGRAVALDLRDEAAVRAVVQTHRPDAIIHTACSNRTPEQIQAIEPAARHLARAAAETGARLVHLSTDLVFDGEQAPYADTAPLTPLGDYGQAKARAEALVQALCPAAVIVRPSLIWGLNPLDHQTRWLVEAVRAGAPVTLFTDERRNPVHVGDLAAALLELAGRPDLTGALNAGGAQTLNRWEFGRRLLAALRLEPGPNIQPGSSRAAGLVRARDLALAPGRAARELRTRLRGVDEVLDAKEG